MAYVIAHCQIVGPEGLLELDESECFCVDHAHVELARRRRQGEDVQIAWHGTMSDAGLPWCVSCLQTDT